MTDAVQVALITSSAMITGLIVNGVISHLSRRRIVGKIDHTTNELAKTTQQVVELRVEVDGRLSEFMKEKDKQIASTAVTAKALGAKEESDRRDAETKIYKEARIAAVAELPPKEVIVKANVITAPEKKQE